MKGYCHILLILVFCLFNSVLYGKVAINEDNINGECFGIDSVSLIFAGDIMGHVPQIEAAYQKSSRSYDFTPCYKFLRPYIQSADLSVANLEVPLAGKPYSGYPRFSSPDALLDGAVHAGFDVMQLANNHIVDRGNVGLERTYSVVKEQIQSLGVYPNQMQRDSLYPLILNVKGVKIALLNCTFGTNGYAVSPPNIVNLIDTLQIRQDIRHAKMRGANVVIMTIHWGNEYELIANKTQEQLADFMVNAGVDAIIGSHPHVVQNFEMKYRTDSTAVPVFYSLGNMISNQRWRNSNGGILARIVISSTSGKISKVEYMPFYVHKGILHHKFQYYLIPTENYRNKTLHLQLPAKDDAMLVTFDQDTRNQLKNLHSFK